MKALFTFLLVPCTVFSQIITETDKVTGRTLLRSQEEKPIVIHRGYAVDALVSVESGGTGAGEDRYFDLIICTHSYRQPLQASDTEVLVLVDGLGKVFDVHWWATRDYPDEKVSLITIRMGMEEFRSIGFAGTVGMKVGANSFSLPYRVRQDMRQLISHIEFLSENEKITINPVSGVKVYHPNDDSSSMVSMRDNE